jgi:lipopolysaccharide export system permease protein
MTVPMMSKKRQSYEKRIQVVEKRISGSFFRVLEDSISPGTLNEGLLIVKSARDSIAQDTTLSKAALNKKNRKLKTLERQLNNEFNLITSYVKSRNKYTVEMHKKFSLPFACILFVLLGAALGTMAKRGGFAVSTSLSFGFFLVYYIFLIGGEELADRNLVDPAVGMWTPNAIFLVISLYLTLHTVREKAPIQFTLFKHKDDK